MYMSTPLKAISEDDRQWSVCMCREEGKLAATSDLPQVMFSTIASIRRSVNHSRIIVPPFYFQLNKNQLASQISLLGQLCKLSSYHCQPPHWGYLTFAEQGRKTADWLKKIPPRACACAFRWPYADAVGSKEWAIRRSYNRAIMNVGCLAENWRALCWNTSLKGLVYNSITLFCFALEVIFVIVLR